LDQAQLAKLFDKRLAVCPQQKAARVILDGVRKNKARVLVGNDAKALDVLARVTGSGYQWVVSAVTSRTIPDLRSSHDRHPGNDRKLPSFGGVSAYKHLRSRNWG
jgi:hypothetical protein